MTCAAGPSWKCENCNLARLNPSVTRLVKHPVPLILLTNRHHSVLVPNIRG
uniref:Uncharacterized protein n=1 Tax=Anguilla anguilla TaxID=7936 RepID=A0A0E9QSN5_ANGAN